MWWNEKDKSSASIMPLGSLRHQFLMPGAVLEIWCLLLWIHKGETSKFHVMRTTRRGHKTTSTITTIDKCTKISVVDAIKYQGKRNINKEGYKCCQRGCISVGVVFACIKCAVYIDIVVHQNLCVTYWMVCACVREGNPGALASGLSPYIRTTIQ